MFRESPLCGAAAPCFSDLISVEQQEVSLLSKIRDLILKVLAEVHCLFSSAGGWSLLLEKKKEESLSVCLKA